MGPQPMLGLASGFGRYIFMMMSSNGNIFRITGLCVGDSPFGVFPSQRPVARSFEVFFDLRLNKRLSRQSRRWWFETPSRSLWRHCNALGAHQISVSIIASDGEIWGHSITNSNKLIRVYLTVFSVLAPLKQSNESPVRLLQCQSSTLRWHHNSRDGVSNHQPRECLLNRLFRRRPKKTSKLHVTGLCERNSPVGGEFPTQRPSYVENVSIWWRHHELRSIRMNK